jgi:precorrin-3B C17-methyltransferase
MALYNPRSKARPEGFARALAVLREACGPERPIIFARAVTTPEEQIDAVRLRDAAREMADMRTVVIVGSSRTRIIERSGRPFVYTPRSVPA